jgi:hypothetical protein
LQPQAIMPAALTTDMPTTVARVPSGEAMTGIEDRHARFLSSIGPRLDNLAPVMVSEHGRGFWTVLDPPTDGADSRVGFLPEGPGLAALESRELAEVLVELLARYDPAYVPPPDLAGRSTRPTTTCW